MGSRLKWSPGKDGEKRDFFRNLALRSIEENREDRTEDGVPSKSAEDESSSSRILLEEKERRLRELFGDSLFEPLIYLRNDYPQVLQFIQKKRKWFQKTYRSKRFPLSSILGQKLLASNRFLLRNSSEHSADSRELAIPSYEKFCTGSVEQTEALPSSTKSSSCSPLPLRVTRSRGRLWSESGGRRQLKRKQRFCHSYSFSRRQRLDKFLTKETGLNARARSLKKGCTPFHVILEVVEPCTSCRQYFDCRCSSIELCTGNVLEKDVTSDEKGGDGEEAAANSHANSFGDEKAENILSSRGSREVSPEESIAANLPVDGSKGGLFSPRNSPKKCLNEGEGPSSTSTMITVNSDSLSAPSGLSSAFCSSLASPKFGKMIAHFKEKREGVTLEPGSCCRNGRVPAINGDNKENKVENEEEVVVVKQVISIKSADVGRKRKKESFPVTLRLLS